MLKYLTYGGSDSQKDFLKSVKHQKILIKQKIPVFLHTRRKRDVIATLRKTSRETSILRRALRDVNATSR